MRGIAPIPDSAFLHNSQGTVGTVVHRTWKEQLPSSMALSLIFQPGKSLAIALWGVFSVPHKETPGC